MTDCHKYGAQKSMLQLLETLKEENECIEIFVNSNQKKILKKKIKLFCH